MRAASYPPAPPLTRQTRRQNGAEAHLETTTTRFANPLAPRSGERARERGSYPPMVVVPRSAPMEATLAGRVVSGWRFENAVSFWSFPQAPPFEFARALPHSVLAVSALWSAGLSDLRAILARGCNSRRKQAGSIVDVRLSTTRNSHRSLAVWW